MKEHVLLSHYNTSEHWALYYICVNFSFIYQFFFFGISMNPIFDIIIIIYNLAISLLLYNDTTQYINVYTIYSNHNR